MSYSTTTKQCNAVEYVTVLFHTMTDVKNGMQGMELKPDVVKSRALVLHVCISKDNN